MFSVHAPELILGFKLYTPDLPKASLFAQHGEYLRSFHVEAFERILPNRMLCIGLRTAAKCQEGSLDL